MVLRNRIRQRPKMPFFKALYGRHLDLGRQALSDGLPCLVHFPASQNAARNCEI
jgi:hypothetical protein